MTTYQDAVDYYQSGGRGSNLPPAFRQKLKDYAKDWTKKLNDEFYDRGNSVGTTALYASVKARHPGDDNYPTKRFVRAWLRRQASNQVYQRPLRQKSDIQAVITSKPNELIQVDYMYFYRHLTGEPVLDEDEMTAEDRKRFKQQQAKLNSKGIQYQGCLNAVDAFSKMGYAVPIKGNLNSKKAWRAMEKIIGEARRNYPKQPIKKVQTDKGSEFMLHFRRGMKALAAAHPGEYKHVYGFEGRSQSQGLVERYNGTIKSMLLRETHNNLVEH